MSSTSEEPIQELILPGVVEELSPSKPGSRAAAPVWSTEDEENVSAVYILSPTLTQPPPHIYRANVHTVPRSNTHEDVVF